MLIAFVIAIISFSYVFYNLGFSEGMRKAVEMLDQKIEEKFRNAGVVVKDDRIIECNGMISDNCKKCIFGRQPVWNVIECFAPDFDGVPVFGVTKDENLI